MADSIVEQAKKDGGDMGLLITSLDKQIDKHDPTTGELQEQQLEHMINNWYAVKGVLSDHIKKESIHLVNLTPYDLKFHRRQVTNDSDTVPASQSSTMDWAWCLNGVPDVKVWVSLSDNTDNVKVLQGSHSDGCTIRGKMCCVAYVDFKGKVCLKQCAK